MKIKEVDVDGTELSEYQGDATPKGHHDDKIPGKDLKSGGKGKNPEKKEGKGKGEGKEKDGKSSGIPDLKKENGEFTFDDIEVGDRIQGTVKFNGEISIKGDFEVTSLSKKHRKIALTSSNSEKDGINHKNVRFNRLQEDCVLIKNKRAAEEAHMESQPDIAEQLKKEYEHLDPIAVDILGRVQAGVRNIWLVGPAGCGKSTIAEMVAKALGYKFFLMSCGAGTSAAEIIGYKYPERAPTRFSGFYKDESIMTLDEFTALDPSVAQIANAALANGMLEITTIDEDTGENLVKRHENCIIIATSNTFGTGASLQYNANNQLDASTRDRFVGGIIEVDYNTDYESQFDEQVVNFVWLLRDVIKTSRLSRIASTRMIQAGEKLKRKGFKRWPSILLEDWTDKEILLVQNKVEELGVKYPF